MQSHCSRNGTVLYSPYYTPTGIIVRNSSTGSIKLITPLKQTAEFFDALHSLAKAFSLHEKHASYSLKIIYEAIKLVEQCASEIRNNIDHISHDRSIDFESLNGPKGSISAPTVDSLHLLNILGFGLRQLKNNTEKVG